jgi:hypothetical protein
LSNKRAVIELQLVVLQASPEEVLEAVSQGVDLFDCSYPSHATAQGYALCFPLQPQQEQQQQQQDCADADYGADDSKLNLWSLQYRCGVCIVWVVQLLKLCQLLCAMLQ